MISINDDTLSEINSNFIIPPKSEILSELSRLAESVEPSLQEDGMVIVKDIGVRCYIENINSPVYGLSRTTLDIKQLSSSAGMDFKHWSKA